MGISDKLFDTFWDLRDLTSEEIKEVRKLHCQFPEVSLSSFGDCIRNGLDSIGVLWEYSKKNKVPQSLIDKLNKIKEDYDNSKNHSS